MSAKKRRLWRTLSGAVYSAPSRRAAKAFQLKHAGVDAWTNDTFGMLPLPDGEMVWVEYDSFDEVPEGLRAYLDPSGRPSVSTVAHVYAEHVQGHVASFLD